MNVRIGNRPNCYYRPDEGHIESDFRCTPPSVFIVSNEAYAFKRNHWHEFVGMADGCCDVSANQEWQSLYNWLLANMLPAYYHDKDISKQGPSYLITVDQDNGKTAHVGSIHRINGRLEIAG